MATDVFWMNAHYAGKCAECGTRIQEDDRIAMYKGKVYCEDCGKEIAEV